MGTPQRHRHDQAGAGGDEPITHSDWAGLIDAFARLDQRQRDQGSAIEILQASHLTLTQQVLGLHGHLKKQDEAIATNTALTARTAAAVEDAKAALVQVQGVMPALKRIEDYVTTGRVLKRVGAWVAGTALGAAVFGEQLSKSVASTVSALRGLL